MITPVGVTSADYTQAIRNGNPTHVRIVFPVQNRTFTDQHILSDSGITLTTIMNPDVDLTMGKAIATEIVINFINSADLAGLDWTEEFRFDMGVDISETTYWVTVGYFKGSRPESVIYTDVINFIAYDRMLLFDIVADSFIESLTFPCTIQDIYEGLCDYVGFDHTTDIEAGDENATTMAAEIASNPFNTGDTCRSILAWIAEINCCYAVFTNEGKIKLKWYTDQTSYEITQDFQFHVSINEYNFVETMMTWGELKDKKWGSLATTKWGDLKKNVPAFSVAALRVAVTEFNLFYQYPNNYNKNTGIYTIVDNPLVFNDGSTVPPDMERIFKRLSGLGTYTPASVDTVGNWLVETGDIVTVVYGDDDTEFVFPIFNRTLTWNGAAMDTYECTSSLDRPAMTENLMTQIKEGGRFHKIILGLADKYDVVNGIAIDEHGIEIVGEKYIKMEAGGDKWKFDSTGLQYIDDNYPVDVNFQITNFDDRENCGTGIYTKYENGVGKLIFVPICKSAVHTQKDYYHGVMNLDIVDEQDYTDPIDGTVYSGLHQLFYPNQNNREFLGEKDHLWGRIYGRSLCGRPFNNGTVLGQFLLSPSSREEDLDKCIVFQHFLTDPNDPTSHALRIFPKAGYSLRFVGYLDGYVANMETTETDLNNVTEKGQYWFSFSQVINKPSALSSGLYCLEVCRYASNHFIQKIYADFNIYTRMCYGGTWGNWYMFSGTQV